jgi:hypothetical protein
MVQGLAFLSKKSWHTKNLNNQEKVWIAEERTKEEARRAAELAKEIQQERQEEELAKIAGGQALTKLDRGIDWMYNGQSKTSEIARHDEWKQQEEFLLGKQVVDTTLIKGDLDVAQQAEGVNKAVASVAVARNAYAEPSVAERNEAFRVRLEDPMFAVTQKAIQQEKKIQSRKELYEKVGGVAVAKHAKERELEHHAKKRRKHCRRDYDSSDSSSDARRRSRRKHKRERSRSHSQDHAKYLDRESSVESYRRKDRRDRKRYIDDRSDRKDRHADDRATRKYRHAGDRADRKYRHADDRSDRKDRHDDDRADRKDRYKDDRADRKDCYADDRADRKDCYADDRADRKGYTDDRSDRKDRHDDDRADRNYRHNDRTHHSRYHDDNIRKDNRRTDRNSDNDDQKASPRDYDRKAPSSRPEGYRYGLQGPAGAASTRPRAREDLGPSPELLQRKREQQEEERRLVREANQRRQVSPREREALLRAMERDAERRGEFAKQHQMREYEEEPSRGRGSCLEDMHKRTHGMNAQGSLQDRLQQNRNTHQRSHESFL